MRALTIDELEKVYGGAQSSYSDIVVVGTRPPPTTVSVLPIPPPLPPLPVPSPPAAVPMPPTPPCTAPANAVNAPFIFGHELSPNGGMATTGYYPPKGNGYTITLNSNGTATIKGAASGMTIGYGVDLGQMSETQLISYLTIQQTYYWPPGPCGGENLTYQQTYNALSPYIGVRNAGTIAAIEAQYGGPPTIDATAASVISNGALAYQISRAAFDYNKATNQISGVSDADFSGLPAAVQTTLADITFVFGSIYTGNTGLPTGVLAAVGSQNWEQLANLLLGATSPAYGSRLKQDGQAIAAGIAAGTIPKQGTPCAK